MKKLILNLVFISSLCFPISGFALEYLWTDDYGSRVFECGGLRVGGRAYIKDKGRGIYRVRGVLIDRQIRATSLFHAAKIACGEAPEGAPVEQEEPQKPQPGPDN